MLYEGHRGLSCDILLIPLPEKVPQTSSCILFCYTRLLCCYANCLGHGHGYECHSPGVEEYVGCLSRAMLFSKRRRSSSARFHERNVLHVVGVAYATYHTYTGARTRWARRPDRVREAAAKTNEVIPFDKMTETHKRN